jgi:hypothetical protein
MMTGDEILAAADRAHTAHPRVSPIAKRNAGSSIILKELMLVVDARSCAANIGARQRTPGALMRFQSSGAGRKRDGRLPAARLRRFAPSTRRV